MPPCSSLPTELSIIYNIESMQTQSHKLAIELFYPSIMSLCSNLQMWCVLKKTRKPWCTQADNIIYEFNNNNTSKVSTASLPALPKLTQQWLQSKKLPLPEKPIFSKKSAAQILIQRKPIAHLCFHFHY